MRNDRKFSTWRGILITCLLFLSAGAAFGQAAAGYSEYFLPGDEQNMYFIFNDLDANAGVTGMHSIISVVAWSANTTIYYDHWENGYTFDPNNPAATADEVYVLPTPGSIKVFESSNVPNVRNPASTCAGQTNPGNRCYDGADHIFVAGGPVTVTRAVWMEARGAGNQGDAWEIYPVKPQLTTYVLPFGEDNFATNNAFFTGFERVYALIQATDDNTTFTVDVNHDGVPDVLNLNRDATWNNAGDGTTVTLQKGQTFLLDRVVACTSHVTCTTFPGGGPLNSGAVIQGNKTLQVKYVAGRINQTYAARGLSAFPRGFWTSDYYAPFGQAVSGAKGITDYYLFNPNATPLTINWQGQTTSGSFSIPGNSNQSYNLAIGANPSVPVGSGLYFSAASPFWGVGFGDSSNTGGATGQAFEWGYSLLPTTFLYKEHFLGWSPGSLPLTTAPTNGNGIFLTVAQDNTRVFVDYNNDGVPDQTYTLNRLQSQFVPPGPSGALDGSRFWATGVFSMAYGENADTATTPTPNLDLGYVALPGTDFVSLVLTTSKTANPTVVSTASGSTTAFTIKANTQAYSLDGTTIVDTMPPNWQFVPGFTTVTKPDLTVTSSTAAAGTVTTNGTTAVVGAGTTFTLLTAGTPITIAGVGYTIQTITDNTHLALATTAPAGAGQTYFTSGSGIEPVVTGAGTVGSPYVLSWSSAQIGGNMAANQQITITFRAATTSVFANGTLSQNNVVASGTRTVGSSPAVTQTFNASDFTYVASGSVQITKASSVPSATPLFPGDIFTYTTSVINPSAAGTNQLTGVSLYDALPTGLSKVAGTTTLSRSSTMADSFGAVAYTNNNGTRNWAGNWTENDVSGNTPGAGAGFVQVAGNALQFGFQATNVRDDFTTASYTRNDGNTNWSAASWTENGDDGTAGAGNIEVNNVVAGNVDFTRCAAAGCNITRTAAVSGGSVTISFGLAQTSLAATEFLEASYDIGAGFQVMETITNGNVVAGACQTPCTISTAGATTITIRFRETTRWVAAHHAQINFVNIAFNDSIGSSAQRTATLTGATSATLNFNSASANLVAGDTVVIEASNAAAGPFTTLATFTAGTPNVAPPYSLAPYISANTTIRFRVTGGINGATKTFSADNVTISYVTALTGADPPDLLSSSLGYDLTGGETLTSTYNVQVNNPFPTGQTSVTNTSYTSSVEIPIQLASNPVTNIISTPTVLAATVSGRLWLDTNFNALQDIGEPGIDNVAVTLKDQFGTPVATAITDSNGRFLFSGITPANGYYVEATTNGNPNGLPPGLTQTAPVGNTNNRTAVFNLAAGQNYSQANLGYSASAGTATFGDTAWVDANGNGIHDPGEVGLGGVTIKLYRDTNNNGVLEIGTDALVDTLVAGAGTVAATSGSTAVVGTGTNFTNLQNGDNISIAGVTYVVNTVTDATHLNLTTTYAAATNSGLFYKVPTTTAPDGSYLFSGITPATGAERYFVTARTPSGYTLTTPTPGSPSSTFTFPNTFPGLSYLSADYGYKPTAGTTFSIKDRIFKDLNFSTGPGTVTATLGSTAVVGTGTTFNNSNPGDSFQINGVGYTIASITDDTHLNLTATYAAATSGGLAYKSFGTFDSTTESGIGGVSVDILDSSLNIIATTVTAADGTFSFSGLTGSGADYTIKITDTTGVLTNFVGTSSYAIAGQRLDSNLVANIDRSATPSYGFTVARSVGDTVFNDLNGNGFQDAGEPGLAGVVVSIAKDANANGVIDLAAGPVTVTATNGSATVTGAAGTTFLSYHPGEPFAIAGVGYIIQSIASNTSLTLTTTYLGATGAGKAYTANPAGAGTVSTTAGSNTVTGAGTAFLTDYKINDPININGVDYVVQSIASNTSLNLTTNVAATAAGVAYRAPVFFGTVTTDASGKYLFPGLANGSYIVSVQSPASYNYIGVDIGTVTATGGSAAVVGAGTLFTKFNAGDTITITTAGVPVTYTILSVTDDTHLTLTTTFGQATGGGKTYGRPDSDATSPGQQLGATVTSGGSILDRDFAFQVPVVSQREVVGKLWNDADKNGIIGNSEAGMSGVTLNIVPLTTGPGTVAATNGSAAVVGTGTTFTNFSAGDPITIAGVPYTIQSITDATHLTLATLYKAGTAAGLAYQRGSTPTQTVTTDANGYYEFTGLANSSYEVQVTDTFGNVVGYGATWEKTEGLITGPNPANGVEVTDVSASPGTAGLTSGSPNVVGTGTTFVGNYRANDPILIGGVLYTIQSVTDNTHLVLTTSAPSTLAAQSLSSPPIDFGYALLSSIPTVVKLRTFDAIQQGSNVSLKWQTSMETDNLGFNIYRTVGPTRTKINSALIAGSAFVSKIHPLSGYTYRLRDTLPSPDAFAQYWLEDVNTHGVTTLNGPYSTRLGTDLVDIGGPDSPPLSGLAPSGPVPLPPAGIGALQPETLPVPTAAQISAQQDLATAPALKISITSEGWYRLTGSAMAAAGFPIPVDPKKISVYCEGVKLPIVVNAAGKNFGATDSVEFYALDLDTPATGARTYWLRADGGGGSTKRLDVVPNSGGSASPSGVPFSFQRIDRTIFAAELTNTGEGENFFGAVITTTPVSEDLSVSNLDPAGGNGTLQLVLQGGTDGFHHQATIELAGHLLGTAVLDNLEQKTVSFTFPQSYLSNGVNTLTMTALGGDNDVSAVVSAVLTYQHLLKADNGLLEVKVPGSQQLAVDGFTNSAIRALDITDPYTPHGLDVAVTPSGGGFKATFTTPPSASPTTVVVFSNDRVLTPDPAALSMNNPSSWSRPFGRQADLLILTNSAFSAAAATLKSARDAGGTMTSIIDVEDIYDEYNFGIKSPQAIRTFLQSTAQWSRAPKYVLLLGDASVDPRNYLGFGSFDFVPTKLVPTLFLKAPSDDWFVDFDDDGIGNLSIGRIPIKTADEAATVINKIATRGTPSGAWSQSALFIADTPLTFAFEDAAAATELLLPPALSVQTIKIGNTVNPRTSIVSAFNSGSLLVDYMGHGSVEIWSSDVFDSTDAAGLTNGTKLPVVLAMTCLNGYFHDIFTESLASALLKAPNGGAVAVWASSTLTDPLPQFLMNKALITLLFSANPPTLGDAIRTAKQATTDFDVRRSWMLFGDPSMKLTH